MSRRQIRWLLPCCTLALMAGILLGRASDTWRLAAVGLGCAVLGMLCARGRVRFCAALMAVVCLGTVQGQLAYHPALPESGAHEISGVVAEEIREGERGQRKTVLRSVTVDGDPFPSGAYWSFYSDEVPEGLTPGVTVRVSARTYVPGGAENPGGFNFREYLLQKGVTLGVYGMEGLTVSRERFDVNGWAADVRHRLTASLTRVMGREAGGYAAAMLLGVRELVADEDRTSFNQLGIAHILSVSGYHVGVLAMLAGVLLRGLGVGRRGRLPILAAILSGYALLTGLHAPVVRAVLLVLLGEYGVMKHRQRVGLHLLCASACIILLMNPAQLTSVSFHLTYGALLGLTLVTPWLMRLRIMPQSRAGKRLRQAFCAALGAQIGLLLPELYWFQSLPVLGVLFNMAVIALSQLVLSAYWLTLLLLWVPGVCEAAGTISAWLTAGLLAGVRAIGGQNWLSVWTCQAGGMAAVGCVLLLAGLSFLWPWRGRGRCMAVALGMALTIAGVTPWPHTGADYVQLSVGNADAAVLHDRDQVWVIDTGEDGRTLATYLHQRRMSVDALVLTHLHTDHAGGVQALMEDHIPVARCYLPAQARENAVSAEMTALLDELSLTGTAIIEVARGDVLPLPDGQMTVLWPEAARIRTGQDANLYSLAMRAEICGASMLLMGDLDGTYELYAAQPADILKAAHHGSEGSTSEAFLAAAAPEAILVSCGDERRQDSLSRRAGGTPVYATHALGALKVTFDQGTFSIEGSR